MSDCSTTHYVGLDVHKETIVIAAAVSATEATRSNLSGLANMARPG